MARERLCAAAPPLPNYCKNCLYDCEGIGMRSGNERSGLLSDRSNAPDGRGGDAGRNKLVLHERLRATPPRLSPIDLSLTRTFKTFESEREKKDAWRPRPQRRNEEFKILAMFY